MDTTLQKIEPYVISIEFDNDVERINEQSWVIGADIQIGDKLMMGDRKKDGRSKR